MKTSLSMPYFRPTRAHLFLLTGTLVACGGDASERGDAQFAAMTVAQLDAAIANAASGIATPYLLMLAADLDHQADSECPRRDEAGGVATFTADDCTTPEGMRLDGRLVATNAPTFDDLADEPTVDTSRPMELELEGWRADGVTYDGILFQSSPMPAEGAPYTTSVAYSATGGTMPGSFEHEADCANGPGAACVVGGSVDQAASYAIAGDMLLASEPTGWLELRGADTLRLEFDAAVDGCAPYTIDESPSGSFCFGDESDE